MPNILQNIARENFRTSGFLSQPGKERRINWEYVSPPTGLHRRRRTDSVRGIMERRQIAFSRSHPKRFSLQSLLNVFFRR